MPEASSVGKVPLGNTRREKGKKPATIAFSS
jgi:hypothetical protein